MVKRISKMFALFSRFFLARDELDAKASKFFRTRDKGLALTWIEPAAPKRLRCFTCHASRTRASRTKIARHAEPHCDARVVALAVFSERSRSLEKAAATCEYEILITPVARRHRSCHRTSSAPPVCSRQSLPWFSALHSLNSLRKDCLWCRRAARGRRSRSKLGVSRRARKWNHIADIF
jgi:hypothetical protein